MKRILIVSQHYWPESFRINDICEGMLSSDIAVDVLCGLPNYPAGEWFSGYGYFKNRREVHDGVNIYRAGEIRRRGNTSARIFLNYISYPITASFNLFRLIGKKYDAIFCYETSPVLMMIPAIIYSKIARVPLTTYVLDLWPENLYSVMPIQNRALRSVASSVSHFLYRRSDKLIAMSPALQEKLKTIAPKRITTTIPQYCEDFYAVDVHDKALSERFCDKFCVVFAGNFSPAQCLDMLVGCAVKLKQNMRNDIHFVLVGNGMSYDKLVSEIKNNNVAEFFSLEGRCQPEDIPKYHTIAGALYAALAKSDDLGLTVPAKIASYMASARPIISAIDGEATRVINEAGCGLTGSAENEEQLYQNIIKLADMSAEQRHIMGQNGRKYYEEHFKRDKLLSQLIEFIFS